MTTNIKLGFPDIPFNVSSITSSATYSTNYPVNNLVTGAKSKFAELTNSMVGTHFLELNLGSGISQASDYIALLDAKRLKASKASRLLLRGSDASYTSPLAISGLIAWFDPNRNVTTDSVGLISQINDQSGNSNHATQSTDANKPVLSRGDNKENLYVQSEDLSTTWTKTRSNVTVNQAVDPYTGNTTIDLLYDDSSASNNHYIHQTQNVISGISYRISCVAKYNGRDISLRFDNTGFTTNSYAHFNLQTGAVTSTSGGITSAIIEDLGSGFYRCTAEASAIATVAGIAFIIFLANPAGTTVYSGDGASGAYVGRCQASESSADATYIKTTTQKAFKSLNGNRCMVFDGSNDYLVASNSTLSGNDKPFTMIIAYKADAITDSSVLSLGYTGSSNPYQITKPNSSGFTVARRDSTGSTKTATGSAATTNTTIASIIFSGTTVSTYINGTIDINAQDLDVGSATYDGIILGARRIGGSLSLYYRGKIGDIIIFNSALSTTDRETIESYLTSKWSDTPIADIDIENMSFTGGQNRDYIEKFTESSEYQYWITQFESESASKRALSKLYFGKMLDIGRDPKIELKSMYEYSQDKAIAEQHAIELEYDGISTANLQTIETKINDYADTNQVLLITNSYNNPLLGNDLLSCDIKSFTVSAKGGRQHALTLRLKETI